MPFEEVPRQFEDVVAPVPQRRDLHVDSVEPIEEIQPEPVLLDELGQRPVGGDDDAGVDAASGRAADAFDGEVLDGTQQLGLRGKGEVRHFVEEQRPVVRVLELASSPADAGRGAVLDAEQLRFEQRLDDRRAVDRRRRAPSGGDSARGSGARRAPCRSPIRPSIRIVKSVLATRSIRSRTAHRQARADERRRTVSASARGRDRPSAVRAFQFQQQSRHLRCRGEHLPCPIVHRTLRVEHRDETRTSFHRQRRQFARDDMRPFGRFALLAEGDGRSAEKRAQRFFEPLPHEPRLPDRRQSGRERGQHHLGRTSPLPVTRGSRHPSSLHGARADSLNPVVRNETDERDSLWAVANQTECQS